MTTLAYRIVSRHLGEYWVPTSAEAERELCQTLQPSQNPSVPPIIPFVLVDALARVAEAFPGASVESLRIGPKKRKTKK